MPEFLQHIVPTPQPDFAEIFEIYTTTHAFYRETEHRQELEQYCQWYYQVSEAHQQELDQMRNELNLMSWFYRSKTK
ncbi:MAG: hypothetical protein Kow00121_57520 [Elainellaceae cyanobacterium]